MKSKSKYLKILVGFVALVQFSSCTIMDDLNEDKPQEGQIYFRWTQDLSNPGDRLWCDMVSGNYKDSNNAVPDYANENTYYGSCEPGTYQAQFNFDVSRPTESIQTFTYTLEKPAPGYVRYYSKQLRVYYPDLNRCVNIASNPNSLTYTDIKI